MHTGQCVGKGWHDMRARQYIGRSACHGDSLRIALNMRGVRRDQYQPGKAHRFQRARRRPNIARMAGRDEDETCRGKPARAAGRARGVVGLRRLRR